MNIKSFIKLIIFIIILSSSASNSFGHGKSESYSNWILSNNNITGIITIPSHEVTRLPMINERTSSLSSSFLKHAEENIFVYSQETSCLLGSSYIKSFQDPPPICWFMNFSYQFLWHMGFVKNMKI